MNYTSLTSQFTSRLALGCFALACGACELNVTGPLDGGSGGAGGGPAPVCQTYDSRWCMDGCEGQQWCTESGQWGACECYGGAGGYPATGGSYSTGGVLVTGGSYGTGATYGTGAVGGYAGGGGYGGCIGGVGGQGVGGTGGFVNQGALVPLDGWLDAASNVYGMQGALYEAGDGFSTVIGDFNWTNSCISGITARVDLECTPVDPITDCYGMYWGAVMGLNLNQPIDPATMMGAEPMPYDASALSGFAFDINGPTIPSSLRFVAEGIDGQYCTPTAVPIVPGQNVILFSHLWSQCWDPTSGAPLDPSSIKSVSWHVVPNEVTEVPFDFCVSNITPLP